MEEGGTIKCLCFDSDLSAINRKDMQIYAPHSEGCIHKRFLSKIVDPNLNLPPIYADQGCIKNEYYCLLNRHLIPMMPTSVDVLKTCCSILIEISKELSVSKMSSKELIDSRPVRMKRRYRKALSLDLKRVHSRVNLFIKFEKKSDPDKSPRAIQYRATPYTARLAKYIVPIEKALYKLRSRLNHYHPMVAKGMNALERGEALWNMYQHYERPYVYLIDHSKFDSRVNKDLLQMEHSFYLDCYKGDRWLSYLLKQQIYNVGHSRNGLRYKCTARRMSGDANTALGNCLINYAILRAKFGPEAIIYLDGDDSVVFMPRKVDVDFSDTGMESKVEIVREFSQIEFCQSKPVLTTHGWLMCREPLRAISRAIYKLGAKPINWRDYLTTIGIGEGLCSPQMPIISKLAALFRSAGGEYKWYFSEYRLGVQKCVNRFENPNAVSRVSFNDAFGIDCYSQLLMEEAIAASVLNWHFQH
ncbi:hypothetical protein 2 [Beihai tombus-like virus 11]|uniref:hypothetical protein 2 n=1 Tax=Beihai tombus-like virus 11 TaxID=1922714 RepID=UPI00090AC9D5|nr:hypothetical protein 2 [Beihai tombus-like virus 11]APG76122.1 hypothetical protein 2 [Beihai tombus-like virus 11]